MQNGWKGAVKLRVNADAMTLYAVTDRTWVKDTTLMDQVKEALEGGITFLQLREKHLSKEEFIKEAREMIFALCDRLESPKEIMCHVRTATEMVECADNSI